MKSVGKNVDYECLDISPSKVAPLTESEFHIGNWNELPDFLKDNEFIIRGYRINCSKTISILKSLFMIHNETFNIWSHLFGFFGFLILTVFIIVLLTPQILFPIIDYIPILIKSESIHIKKVSTSTFEESYLSIEILKNKLNANFDEINEILIPYFQNVTSLSNNSLVMPNYDKILPQEIKSKIIFILNKDSDIEFQEKSITNKLMSKWPLMIHLIGLITCMIFSASFHIFHAKNQETKAFFQRLDYSGISILISCSTFPPYIYAFACEQASSFIFLVIIIVSSVLALTVTFNSYFHQPKCRWARGIIYMITGLSAGIPYYATFFFKYFH